jgi:hypothetical protein
MSAMIVECGNEFGAQYIIIRDMLRKLARGAIHAKHKPLTKAVASTPHDSGASRRIFVEAGGGDVRVPGKTGGVAPQQALLRAGG